MRKTSTVKDPFYPGKAAGDVYDGRFKQSHTIPFLPEHVPQGLATWSNWPHGAPGSDLLLVTSYDPKKRVQAQPVRDRLVLISAG